MQNSVFDKIAADAVTEAKAKVAEIDVVARFLADRMQNLHGDQYRVEINHEVGFVLVRQR